MGRHDCALKLCEAMRTGDSGNGEWSARPRYAKARALIDAGRLEEGAEELARFGDFDSTKLDQNTRLACCEARAYVEAELGHGRTLIWTERTAAFVKDRELTLRTQTDLPH